MTDVHLLVVIPILALAPGFFWYRVFFAVLPLDRHRLPQLPWLFFLGMVTTLIATRVEVPFFKWNHFLGVVTVAPLVEEILKFSVVRLKIHRGMAVESPMSGIACAIAVALGFASIESLLYLIGAWRQGYAYMTFSAALRAALTLPTAALISAIWGFALGVSVNAGSRIRHLIVIIGVALSILAHALFNYFTVVSLPYAIVVTVALPALWAAFHGRVERALRVRSPMPPT